MDADSADASAPKLFLSLQEKEIAGLSLPQYAQPGAWRSGCGEKPGHQHCHGQLFCTAFTHNTLCLGWAVSPFALLSPEDTLSTGVEEVKTRKAIKGTGEPFKLLLVGEKNTTVKIHINFPPHGRSFADIDNSLRMKLMAAALIYTIEL